MDGIIESRYPKYDLTKGFKELPEDINDLNFLMDCTYEYEDYPIKITRGLEDKEYKIEEESYVNKEEEHQNLLKKLE